MLLIDLDPQASLTFSFYDPNEWEASLADSHTIKRWFDELVVAQGDTSLVDLIVRPPAANARIKGAGSIDLVASHLGLINVDLVLAAELVVAPAKSRPKYLEVHSWLAAGLASPGLPAYDVVLIDCPPNFNVVTKTAIVASDDILIPSRADYLSTLGISYLLGNVNDLVGEYNEYTGQVGGKRAKTWTRIEPRVLGVLFTMVQLYGGRPTIASQDFISRMQNRLMVPTFDVKIRSHQGVFAQSSHKGVPVALTPELHSDVAREIRNLATEFLAKIGWKDSND
ncbi:chromosome partitioning protein [Cryptosporangium aurantiacum]|uniref:Chromosome partitioning protein n=1 Tax=Cryptosporangium aurantiacum TaxID=134849 RepID=A0A1M7Q2D5_9ACTN|nr:chromosome partitioning protein [Cryptosporangium aurantiacum]